MFVVRYKDHYIPSRDPKTPHPTDDDAEFLLKHQGAPVETVAMRTKAAIYALPLTDNEREALYEIWFMASFTIDDDPTHGPYTAPCVPAIEALRKEFVHILGNDAEYGENAISFINAHHDDLFILITADRSEGLRSMNEDAPRLN